MTAGSNGQSLIDVFRARTAELPEWLRAHIARVVAESRRLAQLHEVDVERVQAAAWGHDLYRAHAGDALLRLADDIALPVSSLERNAPILLHGPVAAALAESQWGVHDAEVLEAIRWHTTGRAGMSPLATTMFLADKIEPVKVADDPGLTPIRALADRDPEAAMLAFLDRQIGKQLSSGQLLHPSTIEARNALLEKLSPAQPVSD